MNRIRESQFAAEFRGNLALALALAFACDVSLHSLVHAADAAPREEAKTPLQLPGRTLLDEFFAREVKSIAAKAYAPLPTEEAWPAERTRLRDELRDMLGLLPWPPRCDLRPVTTGTIERKDLGIAVEKLHFEALLDLHVTADFYRPLESAGRLPTILYLCGHGGVHANGVSLGNKTHYQHHGTWFARNGYNCLIIDTLQLGEIEGKHHGTYRLGAWWWVSRGYTPAGVEAWFSIRALDYLEGRADVDASRFGVTGRSGGGIGSWWLAALDDRPAAVVAVAGITDLENHILTGAIDGHCDCNFVVNTRRWDFPTLAILAAPKPLLLANTDKDKIFPLDGVLRIHGKLQEAYRTLGVEDRLGLCIAEGPHADTQELQVPAFRWMERWLRERPNESIAMLADRHFEPLELKVLAGIPPAERNTSIEETFVPAAAEPEVPATVQAFEKLREALLAELREGPFRNLPDPDGPLELERRFDSTHDGFRLRGFRFLSEEPFRLDLWVLQAVGGPAEKSPAGEGSAGNSSTSPEASTAGPTSDSGPRVQLQVLDEESLEHWTRALAGPFHSELETDAGGADASQREQVRRTLAGGRLTLAAVAPRGIGPTRWSADPAAENGIRRRLLLLGRPLAETRIHDVRRAFRAIAGIDGLEKARVEIEGRGEMAGIALYAAVLDPAVAGIRLNGLGASHREGPHLLGIQRVLDIPQAVALVYPRSVHLSATKEDELGWSVRAARLFEKSGRSPLTIDKEAAPSASPAPSSPPSSATPTVPPKPATAPEASPSPSRRPNVLLVITDDQGYGDLGLHGNPVIRTPRLDSLATGGLRLTAFHVMPVCAPTRACLFTGRYNYRTGVLDTYIGRALMHPDEVTLAEMLSGAGYRTGLFGKWHLGDNYPMRPGDQGFHESLVHRGGGIGQPSDPPGGTSYFDPILFEDGKPTRRQGYVTDVVTDAAMGFIERHRSAPFFAAVAYNAPHVPLEVPDAYLARYRDEDLGPTRFPAEGRTFAPPDERLRERTARVYGMVTSIDDNVGRLLAKLDDLDLARNTLVVFLTDNGPQEPRYNAGMRERKGSVYQGGIRVPCFWRWPGRIEAGRRVDRIAAAIDVAPTILEALGLPAPRGIRFDGMSLWPLIGGAGRGEAQADAAKAWPNRRLFFQWHRGATAESRRACAIRSQRYKLVQPLGVGEGAFGPPPAFELFDMERDPFEEHDLASELPEVAAELAKAYDAWFADVTGERGFEAPRIIIDGVHENPCVLTRQDWRGPEAGWGPRSRGRWEVRIEGEPGRWRVRMRFGKTDSPSKLIFEAGTLRTTLDIEAGRDSAELDRIELPPGPASIGAWIEDAKACYGVQQLEIERIAS